MNIDHNSTLLHNIGAPPRSAVKYTGLSGFATQRGPGGSGVTQLTYKSEQVFGTPARFSLGPEWPGLKPHEILIRLGVEIDPKLGVDPSQQLTKLIDQRASELPLPEGCAVIPTDPSHPVFWNDSLTALAVLSKSAETVWLRNKTPSIVRALLRTSVSLLVPPNFASSLPEAQK